MPSTLSWVLHVPQWLNSLLCSLPSSSLCSWSFKPHYNTIFLFVGVRPHRRTEIAWQALIYILFYLLILFSGWTSLQTKRRLPTVSTNAPPCSSFQALVALITRRTNFCSPPWVLGISLLDTPWECSSVKSCSILLYPPLLPSCQDNSISLGVGLGYILVHQVQAPFLFLLLLTIPTLAPAEPGTQRDRSAEQDRVCVISRR